MTDRQTPAVVDPSAFLQALGDVTRIPVIAADPFSSIEISKALRRRGDFDEATLVVPLGLAIGSAA